MARAFYLITIIVDATSAPTSGQFVYQRACASSGETAERAGAEWAARSGYTVRSATAQPSIRQEAADDDLQAA